MRRGRTKISSLLTFATTNQLHLIDRAIEELIFSEMEQDELKHRIRNLLIVKYPKGQSAGVARISASEIELHAAMFKEDRQLELANTFLHEVAHFLDYWINEGRGHGRPCLFTADCIARSSSVGM